MVNKILVGLAQDGSNHSVLFEDISRCFVMLFLSCLRGSSEVAELSVK